MMLKHLNNTIADFHVFPNRLIAAVTKYLLFLMLVTKKHDCKGASELHGGDPTSFSRLLNHKQVAEASKQCLNRASRRLLAKVLKNFQGDIHLIIDATLIKRRGKKIENAKYITHGKGYIYGHSFTNFILSINGIVIPLASIPFYTREYCAKYQLEYKTETEKVETWIKEFAVSELLPKRLFTKIIFLMDSGYDAKCIQKAILEIGSKFVMSVKSRRSVGGMQVSEYFRRHRNLAWETIRLTAGNGGKGSRRQYCIRSTTGTNLKGVGEVTVVCSVNKGKQKSPRKYLVCNDLTMTARELVRHYAKRWVVETWHKEIKQLYGFGDCRGQYFSSIISHVNFCLVAYTLQRSEKGKMPLVGTTIQEYQSMMKICKSAQVVNLFGGKDKIRELSFQAIQEVVGF